jgi:polysaccharide transporter, PST family
VNLIKTSLLSGIAVAIKILAMLGINKILAVYVGPSGYALIGQFQNVIQMISMVANGAVHTGVTKYTAQYHDSPKKVIAIWQTATFIASISSLLCVAVLLLFKTKLSEYFLNDTQYENIFVWLALALIALTFNTLLLSILNGKKQILRLVVANVLGSILSFLVIGFFSWQYQLYGALIALAIYQGVGFITTIMVCYKTEWFQLKLLFGAFNVDAAKKLLSFALMALTSALAMPFSSIMTRHLLIERFGLDAAGQWEAMSRISSAYMLFLTSILSVYYLPRFSEIKNKAEFIFEIRRGLFILLAVATVFSSCIYLLRNFITVFLFSNEFKPMVDLFAYQMLGDTLKVCGWLLAYVLLSKAMARTFIAAEILFSLSFYILVNLLTKNYDFKGVSLAYFINYCGYFLALICTLPYVLKKINHE